MQWCFVSKSNGYFINTKSEKLVALSVYILRAFILTSNNINTIASSLKPLFLRFYDVTYFDSLVDNVSYKESRLF